MITFATDIQSGQEPDLLADRTTFDLVLVPLAPDLQPKRVTAPSGGWNHERLCLHADLIEEGDAYLVTPGEPMSPEAVWVGSSEI